MSRFVIETPVPNASTSIGPVDFYRGRAEVDDASPGVTSVLAYCRNAGYAVHQLNETTDTPETTA